MLIGLRRSAQRHAPLFTSPIARLPTRRYHDSKRRHIDPLRILYCGSDEFSVASLRRLHEEHKEDADFIESIDVVCKPPKPYGRGLKKLYQSPIRAFAESNKLPVHPISTFTGWQPPQPAGKSINLIIAVSFGLFVPPRLLNAAKYKGLNIHPSLLPSLRGPAPIQHTLLQGLTQTGISLCTLDSKRFDHGAVLRQETFDLPNEATADCPSLVNYLAPRGADLLIEGLRQGALFPPVETVQSDIEPSHAPKFTSEDAHFDLKSMSADEILRRQKVLAPLWAKWRTREGTELKVQFRDLKEAARVCLQHPSMNLKPGEALPYPGTGQPHIFRVEDVSRWAGRNEGRFAPMTEAARTRKDRKPLVGGFFTHDGVFLTCRSITLPGFQKNHHTEGSVNTVKRLCSLGCDVGQALF